MKLYNRVRDKEQKEESTDATQEVSTNDLLAEIRDELRLARGGQRASQDLE